MKQVYQWFVLAIFLFSGAAAFAQSPQKPILRCYTVERIEELRKAMPNAETDAQFEAWLSQKIKANKLAQRPATNYTIPIVFHIVHNGEAVGTSPNLSASQVQEQLLQLNKDFANASNSRYAVAAATGINFVLAQKDPSNNVLAEPGIDRINRNSKGWTDYTTAWQPSYIDGTVKPSSVWDAARYYNVWVVPKLNNSTTDILGYATFPASSTLTGLNNNETATTAGVVILTGTIGSAFAPATCGNGYGLGKTLSHETGHFFGLRHIWGDTNCGDDFCNDTPVHFDQNNGLPSHPKPNSCGTADEMFENYMDYSDDIVLNTFTANQVDRMQTVMLNSPRRVSLATSNVGAVAVTASNKIAFINCTGALMISETGTNTTYPRFKDVSLTLNVEDKATGAATVSITSSGTAVASQYQLLTPTVTFASGDNFKPVNIRIFDNARVDGDRTVILNCTISGTGVNAGTSAQTVIITITDDDNIRIGENSITLLNENFETSANSIGLPAGWTSLISSSYVNPFVGSANGDAGGAGRCAHITNNTSTKPNTYTKGVSGVAILQSPVVDASSVLALGNLSFNYKIRGLVDNDDATLTYAAAGTTSPLYLYGSTAGPLGYGPYSSNTATLANIPVIAGPSTLANRKFNICFYFKTGTLTTGADPGFNVDNVVLNATPFHVETSVSSSYTYDLLAGAVASNFKSVNNKALASLNNLSANVNAITAQVTAAGSGNVSVTTTTGSYLRSQKVFQISPAVANSTVTYQASFYFTAAELAIWGADRLNLKILKVRDGVSLSSTLNATNAEIITPTVTEDVTAGYITYTGNFTGFSQFMLVSSLASLPVTLINFEATAQQKNILLSWSTTQEFNNSGFFIERSTNGTSFTQVGFVKGAGTTTQTTNYTYTDTDVQPGITYYYRLRQTDIDNRQQYSPIRSARLTPATGVVITVSPNPVKDQANIYITGTQGKATIELLNHLGQKLLQKTGVDAFSGAYNLHLPALSKGVYTIMLYLPEGKFAKKIIVQ